MAVNITKSSNLSFGKRVELYIKGLLLKEGFKVFTPEVDDDGVDIVVKNPNEDFVEIQVKAVQKGALFAAISHQLRKNYWFVFYSEELNKKWMLSSAEFITEASQNKKGKIIGKYTIQCQKLQQYETTSFQRLKECL